MRKHMNSNEIQIVGTTRSILGRVLPRGMLPSLDYDMKLFIIHISIVD